LQLTFAQNRKMLVYFLHEKEKNLTML
jgi:hypothetical protein